MDRKWVIIPDWNNLEKSVEIAKEYDCAFEYNDFFDSNVYMDEKEVEIRINKYLSLGRDTSMDTVHGVFYDIAPTSTDPVIRGQSVALMNQSMIIAKKLGTRGVVFHTGIISGLKLKSYQNNWLKTMEALFRDLCKKYPSLEIYLENTTEAEPTLIVSLAKRMKDVANFKLCLDYAHAILTPTAVEEWAIQFSPYLGHIHLNDNNGIEDLHQIPGEGNMDYNRFYRIADRYLKNVPVLLELKGANNSLKALEYMKSIDSKESTKPIKYQFKNEDLQKVLNTTLAIARKRNKNQLLDLILNKSMDIANCDAGTLYVLKDDKLVFKIMKTRSQNIDNGSNGEDINLPPVDLKLSNACSYSVLKRKRINIPDVYLNEEFDFSGPKKYDSMTGYRTKSMLAIPLMDDESKVLGVMQLINAMDNEGNLIPFNPAFERLFEILAAQAAITLGQVNHFEEIHTLVWSFTEALAEAIDQRTPYNGSHTRQVVNYSKLIADEINLAHDKGLEDEFFNKERTEQLMMSAYLHDIGKMVVPTKVMNKATRLGSDYEKVMTRLNYIGLLEKVSYLEGNNKDYEANTLELDRVKSIVEKANNSSFLSEELKNELNTILDKTYLENGINKPYFLEEEKEALLIPKGTLTKEEREIMEGHVVMTSRILSKVRFGNDYKNAPIYAGMHHEYLDGSGYPNHLVGKDIPTESRILAVADICDALMATDRPYKKPIPFEKSFDILYSMANEGKLDKKYIDYLYNALVKEKK